MNEEEPEKELSLCWYDKEPCFHDGDCEMWFSENVVAVCERNVDFHSKNEIYDTEGNKL